MPGPFTVKTSHRGLLIEVPAIIEVDGVPYASRPSRCSFHVSQIVGVSADPDVLDRCWIDRVGGGLVYAYANYEDVCAAWAHGLEVWRDLDRTEAP